MQMSHAKCLVGYARVLADDRAWTAKFGQAPSCRAKRICSETVSWKNAERTELQRCLKDITAGGCSTGPQTRSAGQFDPTPSASSKRSKIAAIKALDEPIIDTTSDNMWVEAFVTFASAFAAIERKMILMRRMEGN